MSSRSHGKANACLSIRGQSWAPSSQAGDGMKIVVVRCVLPGDVGKKSASEIGDILAQGEAAVDVNVTDDEILGVLLSNAGDTVFKGFRVSLGPPILQITACVELPALIIE